MDYFRNSYKYEWSNTEGLQTFLTYNSASTDVNISFSAPILTCYGCLGSGWTALFQMNVKTNIYRTKMKRKEQDGSGMYRYEEDGTREIWKTFYSGPTSIPNANNAAYYANENKAYLRLILSNSRSAYDSGKAGSFSDYYTTTGVLAQVSSESVNNIEFTIPAMTTDDIEAGIGYKYEIESIANPINTNAMMGYYEATHDGQEQATITGFVTVFKYKWTIRTSKKTIVDPSSCKITTTIYHQDMTTTSEGGPLITKGVKYSAYQLLRKALLTCDTHVIDNSTTSIDEYGVGGVAQKSIDYPILLDGTWSNRLQVAKINETIFEVNNLWEVLVQIGYYLHAIPYLEFARDGTDRFVLKFKQLGGTKTNEDTSSKITIFNSRNLSDYFTQYDSYVTNLFSPQNLIEEWVVPKTSDTSYLVSNNNAELQLSYAITEIVEFDISIEIDGVWQEPKSALEYIFEKSIYDILSNDNPYQVFPAKGSSLYYNLGDNKILGLGFVPPSKNDGDYPRALQRIVQILWQGTDIGIVGDIKYNSLMYHVKYRTQDTARINQFRPDIQDFMKNSTYEKYPHHEQFYNQQGKIIDSERYTANLYGRLIRVGNGIYQRQEYAIAGDEKEAGDLVLIDNEAYYVTAVENEYYLDAIFQKVSYSKNFNQLSNIVTIPSEPRFYEVSERSKIRREIRLMDFFALSTERKSNSKTPLFLNNLKWKNFLKNLIFNFDAQNLPNYAWTRFSVDRLRERVYKNNEMFPSSLLDRSGTTVRPELPNSYTDTIVPLLHYPLHDGIVFSWGMYDNFKAGDFIDTNIYYDEENTTDDDAYLSMQPMRYVDIYGRADLFSFRLFNKTDWSQEQAQQLPRGIYQPAKDDCIAAVQGSDDMFVALDKDCREEISINYHINLLHKASANDDDFITFPNLFGQKDTGKLKIALLNEVQSLFNENQNITEATILADSDSGQIDYDVIESSDMNDIEIKINLIDTSVDLSQVKSIVMYQGDTQSGKTAYIIKNVHKLADSEKLQSWYIYPVYND